MTVKDLITLVINTCGIKMTPQEKEGIYEIGIEMALKLCLGLQTLKLNSNCMTPEEEKSVHEENIVVKKIIACDIDEAFRRTFQESNKFEVCCQDEDCKNNVTCMNTFFGVQDDENYTPYNVKVLCRTHGLQCKRRTHKRLSVKKGQVWIYRNGLVPFANCGVCGQGKCIVTPFNYDLCHVEAKTLFTKGDPSRDRLSNLVTGSRKCNLQQGTTNLIEYRKQITSSVSIEVPFIAVAENQVEKIRLIVAYSATDQSSPMAQCNKLNNKSTPLDQYNDLNEKSVRFTTDKDLVYTYTQPPNSPNKVLIPI